MAIVKNLMNETQEDRPNVSSLHLQSKPLFSYSKEQADLSCMPLFNYAWLHLICKIICINNGRRARRLKPRMDGGQNSSIHYYLRFKISDKGIARIGGSSLDQARGAF